MEFSREHRAEARLSFVKRRTDGKCVRMADKQGHLSAGLEVDTDPIAVAKVVAQ